ncbi:MAG: glycoside hydrolase family 16 protein [Janthinobacterium lividum]
MRAVRWIGVVIGVAYGIVPGTAPARAAPPCSAPDQPAARLTFDDEFSRFDHSPDGSTGWMTRYASGRTLPNELEYYSDSSVGADPFRVENGVLVITARPGPNALGLPYVSGAITTFPRFAQRYGYFEMRAQLPAGRGLWPAFWLLPADRSWPPEIDVFEVLGQAPGTLYVSTHSKVGGPNVGVTQSIVVADVSKGFHRYGVDWRADRITWCIDGRQVGDEPTPADLNVPMFLLANLAVGGPGSWPGPPDSTTRFPAEMRIDYIRAYAPEADPASGH